MPYLTSSPAKRAWHDAMTDLDEHKWFNCPPCRQSQTPQCAEGERLHAVEQERWQACNREEWGAVA